MNKVWFLLLLTTTAFGQWIPGNKEALPLSNASNLQFDGNYNFDTDGNSVFVWTDYSQGEAGLYVQRLDKFGQQKFGNNGKRVGVVSSSKDFSESARNVTPTSDGGALVVWHKINQGGSKDLMLNIIKSNGEAVWADGIKINTEPIFNIFIYEAILMPFETTNSYNVWYNSYNNNTGSDRIRYINFDKSGKQISEGLAFTAEGEKSKLVFDNINNQVVAFIKNNQSDYLVNAFDLDGKAKFQAKNFLNNPFSGVSRMDYFRSIDGYSVIGRTLEGSGQKKVIIQKLDKDLNNKWKSGGAVFGSGAGFDVQTYLNKDGGATCAWIEPNANSKIVGARIDADGNTLWQKDAYTPISNVNYLIPGKFATDNNGGMYAMYFGTNGHGFDMYLQHLDANGNITYGSAGIPRTAFSWYSSFRILPHPDGGVISFFGATPDVSNAAEGYDMYTTYQDIKGEYGIVQGFTVKTDKVSYCKGENIALTTSENGSNDYQVLLTKDGTNVTIDKTESFFKLPLEIEEGDWQVQMLNKASGLKSSNSLKITIQSLSKPEIVPSKSLVCENETLTLAGSCGIGNLNWSTNSTAPTIEVTAKNINQLSVFCSKVGCINSANELVSGVEISQIVPAVTITPSSGQLLEGENLAFQVSNAVSVNISGPDNYTSQALSGTINQVSTNASGTYNLTVSTIHSCTYQLSFDILVQKILSNFLKDDWKFYPNPTADFINVRSDKVKSIIIYNTAGQKLLKTDNTRVNLSDLKSGTYIVELETIESVKSNQKIIKK